MGNLPFDATEEGLRDMIEGNAAVKSAEDEAKAAEDEEESSESQDDDGEDEEEGEGRKSKKAKGVRTLPARGGKNSGLRKVRLGAFEDTGRCKG